MRKIFNKIMCVLLVILLLTSCDDFLTRNTLTNFTDENFWTSEANLRAYTWRLYARYGGFNAPNGTYNDFYFQNQNNIATDLLVGATSGFIVFPQQINASDNNWDGPYTYIRSANLILARIDRITGLSDNMKNHYIGVAKFFRAFCYFDLLRQYGSAVLRLEYDNPEDMDKVFAKKEDRKVIADQIIVDLTDATQKLLETDISDAINRDCAYALLARVALFEGTFRKYHGLGDYQGYLTTAATAAEHIISIGKYYLNPSFRTKYSSDDLKGNSEVIFYKRYMTGLLGHLTQSHMTCSSPMVSGLTKFAVESYVCEDGLPIGQSSLYKGDHGLENVLASRDKRLSESFWSDQLAYNGKEYKEYVFTSTTGYCTNIFLDPAKDNSSADIMTENRNGTDAPLYTLPEIYLIYAEAKAELGTLTQEDLDNTVNKLRARAGIAALQISGSDALVNGVKIEDPKRVNELELATKGGVVSSIVWEIRRERMAEFIGWTLLRHMDLDRWAKGEYLDTYLNPDVVLGAWLGPNAEGGKVTLNADGYIKQYPNDRAWHDRLYFVPIPQSELTLYADEGYADRMPQNPGW